jgi:uncharacterized membrane-anchored protein YitT (DUF2179 family)
LENNKKKIKVSKGVEWKSIFSLSSVVFTITGVFIAVVALKGFMIPNNFLDGGVTAAAILLKSIFPVDFSVFLIVLNIPFLYIGYVKISKTFGIQSLMAVLFMASLMYVVHIPAFTQDKFLIAAFGGFLIGLGIGLVIRGGGIIDGLEVIALYSHKKLGFTSSEIIMVINSVVILGAAFKFGLETAMYSILVYFIAIKTSDYVVDGFEEFTALTVVSKEYESIKSLIVNDFGKAISVYKGERGYLPGSFHVKHDCEIILTVVTRLEIHRIKNAIYEIDPNAFFYVQSIKEVKGGILKRRVKKH